MQKNQEFEVLIEDYGNDGEGVCRIDDLVVFVKDAAKGDRAIVAITKVKKSHAYARLVRIIEPSPDRVEPPCLVSRVCGGCSLMHISYEKQLEWKQEKVKQCLKRIGGIEDPESIMEPIVGLKDPEDTQTSPGQGLRYRNKAQLPVGINKDGSTAIGFYGRHSHNVIDTDRCLLQAEGFDAVIKACRSFIDEYKVSVYDEETGKGLLRHIVLREGRKTGQIQVCLVINGKKLRGSAKGGKKPENEQTGSIEQAFVNAISQLPGVKSIVLNVNTERTNRIMGDEVRLLWGDMNIEDKIGGVRFSIGALSFYQVNPRQTGRMYEKAAEYAGLTGNETVWDLYCGIGTISLFMARSAEKVYGVEIVPQAIEDAKRNAELNGFDNVSFFVGKAEEVLPREYEKNGIHADVIVVDPPRKGCDIKAIETMIRMQPDRIVYVSCDPATLARDIKLLSEGGYQPVRACAFDNFCHSAHIEVCCLLEQLKRAKEFVQIGIDAEDYYSIKDLEKEED